MRKAFVLLVVCLMVPSAGFSAFDFRDEFTTTRNAGEIDGTAAEPGIGTRGIVDTGDILTITGGQLLMSDDTTAAYDPNIDFDAIARSAGLILSCRQALSHTIGSGETMGCVWGSTDVPTSVYHQRGAISLNTTYSKYYNGTNMLNIGSAFGADTMTNVELVLRAAGCFLFTDNELMHFDAISTTTPLYYKPFLVINAERRPITTEYIRIPSHRWLPGPLASDGFSQATTDGKGHPEGIAGSIGEGGSGRTWQDQGTWTIAGGSITNTPIEGQGLHRLIMETTADVLQEVKLLSSPTGGEYAGLICNADAASNAANYIICIYDGTNITVAEIVAGEYTEKIVAEYEYQANTVLRLIRDGTELRCYVYNGTAWSQVGATQTMAANTGTYHGLIASGNSCALENYVLYARGTSGEYSVLNNLRDYGSVTKYLQSISGCEVYPIPRQIAQ